MRGPEGSAVAVAAGPHADPPSRAQSVLDLVGHTPLVDVTAVHWPDDPQPLEMVYHLYSYARNDRLRLKVRVGTDEPVPSVSGIWKSADWNERETYDMFGIKFTGHPDLRRILMPDDYTDFPLRKEFPLYRG